MLIALPAELVSLPPEVGTRFHLVVEGLLGLVWGGGNCAVSEAAEKLLRWRDWRRQRCCAEE